MFPSWYYTLWHHAEETTLMKHTLPLQVRIYCYFAIRVTISQYDRLNG